LQVLNNFKSLDVKSDLHGDIFSSLRSLFGAGGPGFQSLRAHHRFVLLPTY
jgi:hypothetical protein